MKAKQTEFHFSENENEQPKVLSLDSGYQLDYGSILKQPKLAIGQDIVLAKRKLYLQRAIVEELANNQDFNLYFYSELINILGTTKQTKSVQYVYFPGNGFVSWKKLDEYHQKSLIKSLLLTASHKSLPLSKRIVSRLIFAEPFVHSLLKDFDHPLPAKVKALLSELQMITQAFYVLYQPLVIKLANLAKIPDCLRSEAIENGRSILLNALHTYSPEYGVSFVLHATRWLQMGFQRFFQETDKHSGYQHIEINDYCKQSDIEEESILDFASLLHQENIKSVLNDVLNSLGEVVRDRVIRYYGIGVAEESIEEIADDYDVTYQAVNASINRALKKLKASLLTMKDDLL